MNTTQQKKRKRHRKRNNKKQKQQTPTNNGVDFKWEYAFESLTERDTRFKKNHPEYDLQK